jgi:hypothetical protein
VYCAQRLGINTFRFFQGASASTVIGSIGSVNRYGQDLNGRFVTNAAQYEAAVALIRTPQGQSQPLCAAVSSVAEKPALPVMSTHRAVLQRLGVMLHSLKLDCLLRFAG